MRVLWPLGYGGRVNDCTASGIARLRALEREGTHLFHPYRGDPSCSGLTLYPGVREVSLDPSHPRGYWAVGCGTLIPPPLVRDVFASGLIAAAATLNEEDGASVFRFDELRSGTLAVTFGETARNQGSYARTLVEASRLSDGDVMEGYRVLVLPRSAFAADRMAFPPPGHFVSTRAVTATESVQLTAGDVRFLQALLGDSLPRFAPLDTQAPPFTGLFSRGGQLQAHWKTGAAPARRQAPSEADRRAAIQRSESLGRRWFQVQSRLSRPELPVPSSGALGRALCLIEESCDRHLTALELAAVAGLSVSHLYAEFRRALGCTPLDYATDRRLDVAEQMLRETDLSVAAISERCGFAEQTSLTRAFRRRRGTTPAAIRRATRREAETS